MCSDMIYIEYESKGALTSVRVPYSLFSDKIGAHSLKFRRS